MTARKAILVIAVAGASLVGLPGCADLIMGMATHDHPTSQTEESCEDWECWNGRACGECPVEDEDGGASE